MTTIPLDRRFLEWNEKSPDDPELRTLLHLDDGLLTWESLITRRRVVILAEAGSGKTAEMEAQAKLQQDAGQYAFYATVEDVGREGLENALRSPDRTRLAEWKASSDTPAWFFIDSVDEAKLVGIRLERAMRRLSDGIAGAERRTHVVLSGRLTDWEFRKDVERLSKELPVPSDTQAPPLLTPDEALLNVLRHERRQLPAEERNGEAQGAVEKPFVVVMAALDRGRVRRFATAKGAADIDALLEQIEASNLWRFARRPLDLDWLVQFWQSHGRLGTLNEMLENSLRERLNESNSGRSRVDSLDVDRALQAIERIGAALILGRKQTIAIPDSEISLAMDSPSLDLADVLPGWSPVDRGRLLTRPVFDPATFGRARLHNDNQGVVRGYLTARWLQRLRNVNLSQSALFDLIFAETYGIKLIKPSMRETAAWLSLWDKEVAAEIVRRDVSLLLDAGDPASLSVETRRTALKELVDQIASHNESAPSLDTDSVKRFASPDIADEVRAHWRAHHDHTGVRELLLRLVWLGGLKACCDLAEEAAYGQYDEHRYTRILAGRAIAAAGDAGAKNRYAEFIRTRCGQIPNILIWDAVGDLFPAHFNVADLLGILGRIDVADRDGGSSFEWQGAELVGRLNSISDVRTLLQGLLARVNTEPDRTRRAHRTRVADDPERAYVPGISATAIRLLQLSPANEAPELAIDAALWLGTRLRDAGPVRRAENPLTELHRNSSRRRVAFWRAARRWSNHPLLNGRAIALYWEMTVLGYSPGLKTKDIDWLLVDASERQAENEKRLAIDTALRLWHDAGRLEDVRARIEAAANLNPATQTVFRNFIDPPPPDPELTESQRELERITREGEAQRAAGEASWLNLAANLRNDPEQLRQLRPPTAEGVDGRLFGLWQLLSETVDGSMRYAIDSVAPLEPIFGPRVTAALQDGLIAFWRAWRPRLKSTRGPTERNQVQTLDCMGITGITLEAKRDPRWADRLTSEQATLAASYATIEINGFPFWLVDVVASHPEEVEAVLAGEIAAELTDPEPRSRYDMLQDVVYADSRILELMAPRLWDVLEARADLPTAALRPLLTIVAKGLGEGREQFGQTAIARFKAATDPERAALYIEAGFSVSAPEATIALMTKLRALGAAEQRTLAERVLPRIFGDGFAPVAQDPKALPFDSLVNLIEIAYQTVRFEDDHNRPSGQVFSPDERDHAEQARGAAFKQLFETPGQATYKILLRMAEQPDHPIPPERLRTLAHRRASEDSEDDPWPAGEAVAFERNFETAPRTGKDLQRLVMRRLDDMQYDLLHGDFAQGTTLRMLPDETAVQNWIADRLRKEQGRSYSVEREVHVSGEKEPDIRVRAKASDASVAMEIKVAESWSLAKLEEALTGQLCGQYLRAQDARHGVLLLVHKKARQQGWKDERTGVFLTFDELVTHLKAMAVGLASAAPESPQPEISVIDVSSCGGPTKSRRKPVAGKKRPAKKRATSRTSRGGATR